MPHSLYYFILQNFLSQVSVRLNPLIQAEISVLVDVIRAPFALFLEGNESRLKFLHGTFVHKYVIDHFNSNERCPFDENRLIQHAKYLLTQTDENLCLRIMHALKSMVKSNHEFESMVGKTNI